MPRGNGTGPPSGDSEGSRGGGSGLGIGGECVCPSCGTKISHKRGTPCYQLSCPNCGTKMIRKR